MIDEINIFFMNQNTLPQLKKTLWESFEKKNRNTEYSTMHIFFIAIKELSFQTLKVKHLC